jgi:hypothetical protein
VSRIVINISNDPDKLLQFLGMRQNTPDNDLRRLKYYMLEIFK